MTDELLQLEAAPSIGPFFRFPDEATWLTAARDAGFMVTVTDEDGNDVEQLAAYTKDHAIDVVGTITRGGEWDDEGNVVVPPTTLPGWHVNFQGEVPDGWEQYAVTPREPSAAMVLISLTLVLLIGWSLLAINPRENE